MNLPYNHQLDVRKFENMVELKNLTNSYKIFWLRSIIKRIENNESLIHFNDIAFDMLVDSYDFVATYHLKYGGSDRIPNIIQSYQTKTKEEFIKAMQSDKDFQSKANLIIDYVPYRLLTSFFDKELYGLADKEKNGSIIFLSNNNPYAFYMIDQKQQTILINPIWKEYILHNIPIINAWIDFKLIMFLQRRNPSIPNIPFKVNPINNRSLVKQTKLWNKAIDVNPALSFDLYLDRSINTQSTIQYGGFSLDHFIPHSFVMHNELWNLVPVHKTINSIKSNRLPQERFIPDYIRLQYDFFITLRAFGNNKDYEDYLSLTNSLNDNILSWDYDVFHNLIYDNTISLYKIAYNHGYSVWDNL